MCPPGHSSRENRSLLKVAINLTRKFTFLQVKAILQDEKMAAPGAQALAPYKSPAEVPRNQSGEAAEMVRMSGNTTLGCRRNFACASSYIAANGTLVRAGKLPGFRHRSPSANIGCEYRRHRSVGRSVGGKIGPSR